MGSETGQERYWQGIYSTPMLLLVNYPPNSVYHIIVIEIDSSKIK